VLHVVTRWRTPDGKEFDSLDEAEAHEYRMAIHDKMITLLKGNGVPLDGTQSVNLIFLLRSIKTQPGFADAFCALVKELAAS
jgi:hypothetical protein